MMWVYTGLRINVSTSIDKCPCTRGRTLVIVDAAKVQRGHTSRGNDVLDISSLVNQKPHKIRIALHAFENEGIETCCRVNVIDIAACRN